MAFVVTLAKKDDVAAMANLFQEMDRFYDEPNPEPLDSKVAKINILIFGSSPAAHVLLAWDDSRLTGMAAYSYLWPAAGVTQSLYLKELYVSQGYRRQGVGKLLMRRLIEVAVEHRCSRIEWTTDESNLGAQNFYQELGIDKNPSKIFYRLDDPIIFDALFERFEMEDLKYVFGDKLLSYLFDTKNGALPAILTNKQQGVCDSLRQIAQEVQGLDARPKTQKLRELLLTYIAEQGTTLANTLRIQMGGLVYSHAQPGDTAANELLLLARDSYPGFLLPLFEKYGMLTASPANHIADHPANYRFIHEVLTDQTLVKLFPDARPDIRYDSDELKKISSFIVASSGHGSELPLWSLSYQILKSAYERMLLDEQSGITSYLDNVLAVLKDVRTMARDKQVEIPVAVGLRKINLPPGEHISAPGTKIRTVRPEDSHWLPPFDRPETSILVTMVPLKLLEISATAPFATEHVRNSLKFNPGYEVTRRALRRRIDLARFALLLSSPPKLYHAAQEGWTRIFDPFYEFGIATGQMLPSYDQPRDTTIDPTSIDVAELWIQKTLDHPKQMDIAMRRLLSAATVRSDPLDGLIDAVLAWENMFSATPETTLRVCGAISCLLNPEAFSPRQELYEELKKLYGARSSLVHGQSEPSIQDAVAMRDRAVEIGLQSMRRLYDYPDLLGLDAPTRGLKVLLGATRDSSQ
jgi:GNAT superfamily N-acetyltransferase